MAAASNVTNKRRAQRIRVTPRGELIDGGDRVKVLLQDISDDGFQLLCSREFKTGKVLQLQLSLSPGVLMECSVEVRHSSDLGTGVKILSIGDQHRRAIDRYLQEYFSHNVGRLDLHK
jgi:hypothetical protein